MKAQLPPYYTWGMLKDLTRKVAPHPGWTEMASNPQGMQKGRGWIKIKRAKDAFNLYGMLSNHGKWKQILTKLKGF
jgi:hypothetical protein